jgi:hypothetical protein
VRSSEFQVTGMLQVIGKNQFNPNNAPSTANANVRRHSSRHCLLTGVKGLQVSHDCFGIGAYHVKPRHRGRRGLPLREIEVVSSVIIATLLCI